MTPVVGTWPTRCQFLLLMSIVVYVLRFDGFHASIYLVTFLSFHHPYAPCDTDIDKLQSRDRRIKLHYSRLHTTTNASDCIGFISEFETLCVVAVREASVEPFAEGDWSDTRGEISGDTYTKGSSVDI